MSVAHRSHVLLHGLLCVMLAAPMSASATERPVALQQLRRCDPPTLGRDRLSVVCVFDEAAGPQRVHIKVHFTGSHDDTTASIEITLGDVPVACDDESKTSTEGEDGDVTLDCRFTAAGGSGAAMVLCASAEWFHAQYVGLEVNWDRP